VSYLMDDKELKSFKLATEIQEDGLQITREEQQQMYLKTHQCGTETLIAVCDCILMGKKFEEGPLHIEIQPDFFGEQKATTKDVESALAQATIANLVGEQSVGHAVRLGYIDQENVLRIEGIPCAQMVLM
jgi:uncharacterized protein